MRAKSRKGRFAGEEEAVFCGGDRGGAEAGRLGSTLGSVIRHVRDHRAVAVSVDEAAQGDRDGRGPPVQTNTRRKWAAETTGGGADVGQDDALGTRGLSIAVRSHHAIKPRLSATSEVEAGALASVFRNNVLPRRRFAGPPDRIPCKMSR